MRHLALCLALLGLACEPPAAARLPIVDGARETGEPAVVAVVPFGGLGLCTGTLISPKVVLTAKHCVQASGAEAPFPANVVSVGIGDRADALETHRARAVVTTPGVYYQDPRGGLSGALVGVDVAAIVLREPIEGITPIPIRRDRPSDLVGQEFTAIGFGRRPDGPAGLKYRGSGVLTRISGTVLFTEMTICQGDSGGPMIQEAPERQVVGVASFGEAGTCPSATDGYNALFEHLDVIDRAFVMAGDCLGPSEETCNGLDDDCDGTLDEGCAAIGAPCAADTDCAFGPPPAFLAGDVVASRCQDLGAGPVCTRPCATTDARSCAAIAHVQGEGETPIEGGYCRVTAGCEGRCAIGASGDAVDGAACAGDGECASQHCADPGDGRRRCLPVCRGGAGTCPVGEACAASVEACGFCVEASLVIASRQLGEPCGGDAECADPGVCVDGACGGACTTDVDCAAGYRCEAGLCRRGGRAEVGEPCRGNPDCRPGNTCSEGGYCTRACADDHDCPEGLACGTLGGLPACVTNAPVLGQACDGVCALGVCERGTCTRVCGASATCPLGFACARDDEGRARCRASGGCAAGLVGQGDAPLGWLALAALLLLRRRPRAG